MHGSQMGAAALGRSDVVEVLLEAGASLEWQTTSGVTALMGAAMTGATEVITQLVLAGCSLDVQDGTGNARI